MASQRSLFNDSTLEVNELTSTIQFEIKELMTALSGLERLVQTKANDSSQSVQSGKAALVMVAALKADLADRTSKFSNVLKTRTESIRQQTSRRHQFEAASSSRPLRKRTNNAFQSLLEQKESDDHNNVDNEPSLPDDPERGLLQSQQMVEPESTMQDNEYFQSRANAVENIEKTIVELGSMYQRLSTIVGMQEEVTVRIDANMDSTLEHMDRGHRELLKYFDRISGNRWLILKVFAVLIVFLVFFMLFIA